MVDDDEDVGVPLDPIIEPRDPYLFRPLPLLIGTAEFMQDDYVGLGDLLTVPDEEAYVAEPIQTMESDSVNESAEIEIERPLISLGHIHVG